MDIGGLTMNPSVSARNLGVVFGSHLTLNQHVTVISKKGYYQLQRISKICRYLDKALCTSLDSSLIVLHRDYVNSLLYGLPDITIKRLQNTKFSCKTNYQDKKKGSIFLCLIEKLKLASGSTKNHL